MYTDPFDAPIKSFIFPRELFKNNLTRNSSLFISFFFCSLTRIHSHTIIQVNSVSLDHSVMSILVKQ